MAMSRQSFPPQDYSSSPPTAGRSREGEGPGRWNEYLGQFMAPPTTSTTARTVGGSEGVNSSSALSHKGLNIQWVHQLTQVAEGLMAKIYRLNQILDYPDSAGHVFSDAFWKASVLPNHPKICVLLSKKFPEHYSKLQLERVDRVALDAMNGGAEVLLQSLEPWIQLLLDLMAFREQALRLILDLSSTVITLLPHQNALILHAFMDLFCAFVRVNLFADKIPRKMMLQTYNLLYGMLHGDRDCDFYHRLVQYIDSYDQPLKGLHEDLNFVSPRIGEVLEAVGPTILLSTDTRKLRNEGFLSPFHPRYPDILTNSAHPMRAQDLANVTSYREWVLFGYLVCPDELLRVTSNDIASVVLKENLVLSVFRDEYILLHEDYQSYVLPRILESKKMAKSGRTKQKETDLEYSIAKQVEKMISEVHEQALLSCDSIHHERRILLKQEIGRMVLFFTDQPSLLAPNIQMVFSALALVQYEIIWYFQHVGVASARSKSTRIVAVEIDPSDPTIGFLLDGMDRLCCLVRKYIAAIRGYALSYLSSSAGRIRFLLGTPGMVALDLDTTLKGLFQKIVQHLENIPKLQGENISAITCDLSELRKDWLSILMIVTSARSSITIRHLEKATVSTGKEGLLSEGNAAYNWSRCVDELESQLSKHGNLKKLYFYHQHLTTVFRNTMFGPEGRPQHCCAWLGVASSFPDCASIIVPEEVTKIGRDAVMYVESLIESIMGGMEGLVNILDSEGGFGSLEMQLLPEQAANLMNLTSRVLPSAKSPKGITGFHFPGYESFPENSASVNMLEAAMQRLMNLCSVLNDMEPICVLNHVFVLREYMRECILGNLKRRLHAVLKNDSDLQRPSVMESLIRRHVSIVHLVEQHVSMDLTQGIREVLLNETFCGPVSSLHLFEKPAEQHTGTAVESACNWYVDNIVKDVSGASVLFAPLHRCFKSMRPVGGYFAQSVTNLRELQAFIRIFGSYGVDRLDRMMKEHTVALLNCIDTSLRANREILEAVAGSMHTGDRIERDAHLKQIIDIETVIGFCIQAGQAVAFDCLLAEAAGNVLEEGAPLIHSLLAGIVNHLPEEIPEKKEMRRMRRVANSVSVVSDHDSEWVRSILEEVGGANDGSWSLLPYFFATFMTSNIWTTTAFNVDTGGFNNNIHCLARCICAVIAGSEFVRLERECQQRQSFSNGHHVNGMVDPDMRSRLSAETSIKATMQLFVKFSAGIILDTWTEPNRSLLVAKLIFLDQMCEISPYLPRSSLEVHIPCTILRSIYSQYYTNLPTTALASLMSSPRHSPAISLVHASPAVRVSRGDSTPQPHDYGYYKPSSSSAASAPHNSQFDHQLYESGGGDTQQQKHILRNNRRSGPLNYSSSSKNKFEGSTSGSTGPPGHGALPARFAVSRSGPISYYK